jgi:hypothetical protein
VIMRSVIASLWDTGRRGEQEEVVRLHPTSPPQDVVVRWAQPVQLTFRWISPGNAGGIVFPDLGRMVTLPASTNVTVELDLQPGHTYEFFGAQRRLLGRVIVTPPPAH